MNRCKYVEVQVAMIRNGLTRLDMAARLGVSPNTFSNKMNGKKEWTLSEVYRVCDALNIPKYSIKDYFPEEA